MAEVLIGAAQTVNDTDLVPSPGPRKPKGNSGHLERQNCHPEGPMEVRKQSREGSLQTDMAWKARLETQKAKTREPNGTYSPRPTGRHQVAI